MSKSMISNSFLVTDEHELNVLQRIFREAKFCTESDDLEIVDSPIVAEMYERLIKVLIEHNRVKYGEIEVNRMEIWLTTMNETRDEWHAVFKRILKYPNWLKLTKTDQKELVKTMFRPFLLSEEKLSDFIFQVNQKNLEYK